MSMKDLFVSFYSPVVDLRLQQIAEAKQHLAFTRSQECLHGQCAYWDEKIDAAQLVLKICKRDFYEQVRRESAPFCYFMLGLGFIVYLQW